MLLNRIGDASPYLKTVPHIMLIPTHKGSLGRIRYLPREELRAVP